MYSVTFYCCFSNTCNSLFKYFKQIKNLVLLYNCNKSYGISKFFICKILYITSPSLQVRSDKLFVGNGLHVRVCDWYNVVDVAAQHPDPRPLHGIYSVGIIVGSSNTQIVPLIIDRISSILLIPEELTTTVVSHYDHHK